MKQAPEDRRQATGDQQVAAVSNTREVVPAIWLVASLRARASVDPWSLVSALPLLVALALFLALALPWLDRPGLHYDEALEAGLPAVQLLHGQTPTTVAGGTLQLGDLTLPLMVQNHIGALQIYAALPFVAIGGPTAGSLRLMTVVSGVVTLLAVYAFMVQIYGRLAASVAVLWLAAFPSFVFWMRQGTFVTSLTACFAACALTCGAYWWRTRRLWAAALTGLCAGLAVYAKLNAAWLVVGVFVWMVIVWVGSRGSLWELRGTWRHLGTQHSALSTQHSALAVVGFLLGCWPLLLFNLLTGGTFRVVQLNARETYLGASNVDVLGNLQVRLAQAADVISSGEHLWYLGSTFPNPVALASVLVALVVIVARVLLAHGRGWQRMLFLPFLGLAVIAQSCYTISALWPTHFAVAVMLPAMIVGAALSRLQTADRRPQNTPRPLSIIYGLSSIVLALVLATQLWSSTRYLEAARNSGGMLFHSSAIYDLARFLDGHTEHVVALDWGIAAPVQYLTNGRVVVEEFYGYEQEAPPEFGAALRERFGRGELYVTHAEHQEAFKRRAAFLQAVADAGMVAEPINVSIRADGWPMLEVWRVKD